jgi:hypothetical protein
VVARLREYRSDTARMEQLVGRQWSVELSMIPSEIRNRSFWKEELRLHELENCSLSGVNNRPRGHASRFNLHI